LSEMPIDEVPDPTTLPSGSAMPLSPNLLFVGRREELKALANKLRADSTTDVGPVVIAAATGLGGIGKTQLASEFVHRYGQYFSGGVFWLNFADADAIPAEVAACGGAGRMQLRSDFHALPLADQVSEVMSAWQSELPRLLVFDNCEHENLLAEWRPITGGCRVLVTSRRERWDRALGAETVRLDVLTREESVALLREHRTDLPEDDAALDAIAKELGDLPLALDLSGRYLDKYRSAITPAQYLEELRRPDLLKHRSLQEGGISPTGHKQNVARTFALSYERLDAADPSDSLAIALLHRAARFAPGEPIPQPLLLSTLVDLSDHEPEERLRAEDALRKLAELGLLETEEEASLRMHRLVAAFVRDVGDDEEAQAAVEARLVGTSVVLFEEGYVEPLLVWLPHLRAAAAAAEEREDASAAQLYAQLGLCLFYIGAYNEAQDYLERALSMRERILGEEHPDTVTSLNNLANLLVERGSYDEARPLFERALAIREKEFGPEHHKTAQSLNNLGRVLAVQGSHDKARSYFERALRVYESTLGQEHPDAVHTLGNIASTLRDQGDFDGARRLYERALSIFERTRGEEHPFTAAILDNLGNMLAAQGKYGEARPYLEGVLSIREKTLGEEHPDTIYTLGNLAIVLVVQGDFDRARRLFERKLAINERLLRR
jgi:tetratricopeptide (TPR) repeat protein